jgi:hypothetical protein
MRGLSTIKVEYGANKNNQMSKLENNGRIEYSAGSSVLVSTIYASKQHDIALIESAVRMSM